MKLTMKVVSRSYADRKYEDRFVYNESGEFIAKIVECNGSYVAVVAGGALAYLGAESFNGPIAEEHQTPEEALCALERHLNEYKGNRKIRGYGKSLGN